MLFKPQVVKGKVEEVELPEKADILISEPMGNNLVFFFEYVQAPQDLIIEPMPL